MNFTISKEPSLVITQFVYKANGSNASSNNLQGCEQMLNGIEIIVTNLLFWK